MNTEEIKRHILQIPSGEHYHITRALYGIVEENELLKTRISELEKLIFEMSSIICKRVDDTVLALLINLTSVK